MASGAAFIRGASQPAVVVVDVLVGVVKYLQSDTDLDTKGYRYRYKYRCKHRYRYRDR